MMEPPLGFVPLRDAADMLGRKACGSNWRPLDEFGADAPSEKWLTIIAGKLDIEPEDIARVIKMNIERVIKMIAEQCEAGGIAAVYRSAAGSAEPLDRGEWHKPHWRSYFSRGKIDFKLPALINGRPNANGDITRCTCEIFVRLKDVDRFIAELSGPAGPTSDQPKAAPYDAYEAHQQAMRETTGRFASREDDEVWARQNKYVVRYVRDELRPRYRNSLSEQDHTKFQKPGPRN
jgi:hypothetical protein